MSVPEMPNFEGMVKRELLAYADEHGIEGLHDRMTNADIIAAIKEAMGWI